MFCSLISGRSAALSITYPRQLLGTVWECAYSDINALVARNWSGFQICRDIQGLQGGVPGGNPEQTKQVFDIFTFAMLEHFKAAGLLRDGTVTAEDTLPELQALSLEGPQQHDSETESDIIDSGQ